MTDQPMSTVDDQSQDPWAGWPDAATLRHLWPILGRCATPERMGSSLRFPAGDGDPGEALHLKWRARQRMPKELYVLAELDAMGVPVTVPIPTADRRASASIDGSSYLLYRELPGRAHTDRLTDDAPLWMNRVGRACATLQQSLARVDPVMALAQGLPRRQGATEGQIIHGDFHAGNVLFADDGAITGYLDFDHLEFGPRLVDVVYASGPLLAGLIDGETTPALPDDVAVRRWLELWEPMVSGWAAVHASAGQPMTVEEADAAPATLVEVEEAFTAWFLSMGDTRNAALTSHMIELAQQHADEYRAIARRVAAQTSMSS